MTKNLPYSIMLRPYIATYTVSSHTYTQSEKNNHKMKIFQKIATIINIIRYFFQTRNVNLQRFYQPDIDNLMNAVYHRIILRYHEYVQVNETERL